MSPENLLKLAYSDINALLVGGFDTNADDLVDAWRNLQDSQGVPGLGNVGTMKFFPYPIALIEVAHTLANIQDMVGKMKVGVVNGIGVHLDLELDENGVFN